MPTLEQNGGPLNSQGPICPGDAIQPITFEWSGVSTVVIEDLNTAYTPSALFGGTVTTTGLPIGWYRVYNTNSFTITGTAGPTDFFTIRTEGSDCTEQFLDYSITVNPNAARPDVIMQISIQLIMPFYITLIMINGIIIQYVKIETILMVEVPLAVLIFMLVL